MLLLVVMMTGMVGDNDGDEDAGGVGNGDDDGDHYVPGFALVFLVQNLIPSSLQPFEDMESEARDHTVGTERPGRTHVQSSGKRGDSSAHTSETLQRSAAQSHRSSL